MEALGTTGCGLCRLGARTVSRYLDILAYENVNDVTLRETIRLGLGLCNRHAWQFIDETRAPLGTAIIYRDMIRTLQQHTTGTLDPSDGSEHRLHGLIPQRPCVACSALAVAIQDCAHQFLHSLTDYAFRSAFDASEGLCWPHLLAILNADRFARRWREILGAQRHGWERRIARTLETQSTTPVLEALASAPRLNGTQIGWGDRESTVEQYTAAESVPTVLTPPSGQCPVCASVATWLSDLSPLAGLPCAVHAWRSGQVRSADNMNALVDCLSDLDDRLTRGMADDLAGPMILRVAERVRRGSALPSTVTLGLDCSTCLRQQRYEASLVARLEPTTLCVPHLRVAAQHHSSFAALRAETRRTWRTIEGQLDEVIRKYDYRFTHEPRGEEQSSPRWAIALVAGAEGIR